jgi:predicted dehydrogenase
MVRSSSYRAERIPSRNGGWRSASSAPPRHPVHWQTNMTSEGQAAPPLRWGILGCGDIARATFGPCLVRSPNCELVAVSRRDETEGRRFAEQFGAEWQPTDAALLARADVDAVVIATPPHLHRAQTLAAARAGKHVLVEKPMALDPIQCKEMFVACRAAGVRLGVAYRRRLFPQVVAAKRLIEEGAIGRVTLVRSHYSGWMEAVPGHSSHWRIDPEISGGGALMDMACHRLEVMLNLGGDVEGVSAMIDTVHHPWPVEDTACLLLRFADGALGVHSTTLTSPPRYDFVEVDGTHGKLLLDPMEYWADHLRLISPEGERRIEVTPVEAAYQDLAMIEDFVAAVREEREPVCSGAVGVRVQEVIEQAYRSAATGRTI